MTKAGIEYNLEKTPYILSMVYGAEEEFGISFHFSSESAMDKFKDEYIGNREFIRNSLSNRFKMHFMVADDFCDVQLYKRVERRGFYIQIDMEVVQWPGRLVYDGTRLLPMTCDEKLQTITSE